MFIHPVQEYLKTHTLTDLYKNHGIRSSVYGHLMSLNYHQIKSSRSDQLACQCRGVVLRHYQEDLQSHVPVGKTDLYAWPFNRFFNYHEGDEVRAPVDWGTATIQEKLDGTLCIVYYDFYKNRWNVGTRNTPFAQFPPHSFEKDNSIRMLFAQGIEKTTGLLLEDSMTMIDPNKRHTWLFELTSPINRLVVQYDDLSITCLGKRCNLTGGERDPVACTAIGIPLPKTYALTDFNEVISFVQKRPADKHEGVVVVDAEFNRIKVKSAAHALRNDLQGHLASSPRKITDIILEEGWDDVAASLPPYIKYQGDLMVSAFRDIIDNHVQAFESVTKSVVGLEPGSQEHRKAFALAAKAIDGVDVSSLMYAYGRGVHDLVDWFHYKDYRKPSQRIRHVHRITKNIRREMERNGTSQKEFWVIEPEEITEEENE